MHAWVFVCASLRAGVLGSREQPAMVTGKQTQAVYVSSITVTGKRTKAVYLSSISLPLSHFSSFQGSFHLSKVDFWKKRSMGQKSKSIVLSTSVCWDEEFRFPKCLLKAHFAKTENKN